MAIGYGAIQAIAAALAAGKGQETKKGGVHSQYQDEFDFASDPLGVMGGAKGFRNISDPLGFFTKGDTSEMERRKEQAENRANRTAKRQKKDLADYIQELRGQYNTQLTGKLFDEENIAKSRLHEEANIGLARKLASMGLGEGRIGQQAEDKYSQRIEQPFDELIARRLRGAQNTIASAERSGRARTSAIDEGLEDRITDIDEGYKDWLKTPGQAGDADPAGKFFVDFVNAGGAQSASQDIFGNKKAADEAEEEIF